MAAAAFESIPVIDVAPLATGGLPPRALAEELTTACHGVARASARP